MSSPNKGNPAKDCWDTWSRCTEWSSPGTGILWKSCENQCKSKGYATGTCKEVTSTCPLTNTAKQCQCSGKVSEPNPRQ
ncbi:hypothetical protein ACJMK2_007913 [Sinanodonta woodiana]|uniref:Uncharacterized protein n=1 Tax=Sinanodonta woodiana TaxID=1069815 RepID=A0ABD3VKE7_SINWO